MAGRGGFKGPSTSLRPEQLQGMGIMGKDMPTSIVAPPPTYPPLLSRPAVLEVNESRELMIKLKEDFQNYLKKSPYYTGSAEEPRRTQYFLECAQRDNDAFNWPFMPSELKPNWKRKAQTKNNSGKVQKVVDIEERLKELEQKEKNRKDDDEPTVKDEDKETENESGEENLDMELDDENDYLANYFETGDSYLDEDDNLDDGPTY